MHKRGYLRSSLASSVNREYGEIFRTLKLGVVDAAKGDFGITHGLRC